MPFLRLLFMVLALGQNDHYNCYISAFLEWLLHVTAKLIEMVWYLHPSYKHRRHVSWPPFTHLVQLGTFKGQPVCAWPLLRYPALFRGIHVVHFSSFLCILQHGHRSYDLVRLLSFNTMSGFGNWQMLHLEESVSLEIAEIPPSIMNLQLSRSWTYCGTALSDWEDSIMSRSHLCGLILHILCHACGTENMFISDAIKPLLFNPTYLFVDHPNLTKPKTFLSYLQNHRNEVLSPLIKQIESLANNGGCCRWAGRVHSSLHSWTQQPKAHNLSNTVPFRSIWQSHDFFAFSINLKKIGQIEKKK